MSLEYAILGFLNYQPFSGYDLKKIFDATVRHFWPADQSQIYRTLAQLTEKGCVEMRLVEQSHRPDRKVYHITAVGKKDLARWMLSDPPMEPTRSAALIQVFFLGRMADKQILAKFEAYTTMTRGILKLYDGLPDQIDEYAKLVDSPREVYFWLSTLDLGKRTMRANLEWAEHVIAQIKAKKIPHP
jgi:PadR family transcriptional regulator AphA